MSRDIQADIQSSLMPLLLPLHVYIAARVSVYARTDEHVPHVYIPFTKLYHRAYEFVRIRAHEDARIQRITVERRDHGCGC